jgi:hypothetical protein
VTDSDRLRHSLRPDLLAVTVVVAVTVTFAAGNETDKLDMPMSVI